MFYDKIDELGNLMKKKEFDLSLGDFGPYNKEYLGVCHIADKEIGATFNVELFPDSSEEAGMARFGCRISGYFGALF